MIGHVLLLGAVALTCYVAIRALGAVIDKSIEVRDLQYFAWARYLRCYGDKN